LRHIVESLHKKPRDGALAALDDDLAQGHYYKRTDVLWRITLKGGRRDLSAIWAREVISELT